MSLVNVNVQADCIDALRAEIKQKHPFVLYKFTNNFSEVVLDRIGDAKEGLGELVASFPDAECRFATVEINYDLAANEGKRSKTLFLMWCPMEAPVKARLIFASAAKAFKTVLANYGVGLTVQCGDRADLSHEALLAKCKKIAA